MTRLNTRAIFTVFIFCGIAALTLCRPGWAFVVAQPFDIGARWREMPIKFYLSEIDHPDSIGDYSELNAVYRALQAWSHVSGSKLSLEVHPDPFPGTCADAIAQGVNIICFIQDKEHYKTLVNISVTANIVALSGAISTAGLIPRGAYIILNEEDWAFRTDTYKANDRSRFDLRGVITHEVGHVIGLDHSGQRAAVMAPMNDPATSHAKYSLHEDDIRGAQYLYPDNQAIPGMSCGIVSRHSIYLTIYIALLCIFCFTARFLLPRPKGVVSYSSG